METQPTTETLPKRLWALFWEMLRISAFTFGGGFVIVTLMRRRFVEQRHWLTEAEMLDYTALAQTAPGAIAINAAVLVGRHIAGTPGMLAAVLGTAIPPVALLSVISVFYAAFAQNPHIALLLRGMQAGVAAVLLDVACSLGVNVWKNKSWVHDALLLAAFILSFVFRVSVVWLLLGAAGIGAVLALLERKGVRL